MLGQGLYGLAMGMSNSHEMSYRQLVTPDELQARTNTTLRSLNRAVMVVTAAAQGCDSNSTRFSRAIPVARCRHGWPAMPARVRVFVDFLIEHLPGGLRTPL